MGSFANTVFSALLGWLQILISMIWSAFTSEDGSSFLQFIGNNWIWIAAVLCATGLIADFAVYFFRWQPYKVWKTFLRHLRGKDEASAAENEEEDRPRTEVVFRFSSNRAAERAEETGDGLERWQEPEPVHEEPEIRGTVTKAGYIVPEDSPYRRPVNNRRNRRIRINSLLGDPDEEEGFHYFAPRPVIDQKEAYRAPVYPEKWTGSRDEDS